MDPILDDLNPSQRAAVEYGEGPMMVIAGAGSGKTRVITRRIARLLRDGAASDSILALTFTNKAAGEMARRVLDLGGRRVHVATFHSACARFLRRDGHYLGYPRDFSIYDTYDRDSCIKALMQERQLPLTPIKPSHIGAEISRMKNLQIGLADYRETVIDVGRPTVQTLTAELFDPYIQRMQQLGAMDFDDLIGRFLDLLELIPEVAERYAERFRWILVDEFQDTNRVQYELVCRLAAVHRNVCVVGDPDQSIYRFRGAEIRNILDFADHFGDVHTVRLEVNYRSTQNILGAAQGVIVHNTERLERDLTTDNDAGSPLEYHRFGNPYEENDVVGGKVERLVRDGASPAEIAVFYRSHYLSRGIEEVLRRAGVPYSVVGGLTFFERREIKDLVAYLRAVVNPLDDVSMERIINVPPRKIGVATLAKLKQLAASHGRSLYELVVDEELHAEAPKGARRGLAQLRDVFLQVQRAADVGCMDAVRAVIDGIDYIEYACNLGDPQDQTREENIGELVADAADFDTRRTGGLAGYLEHISLLTSADRAAGKGPSVSLMTIHAAKGLEFDHVFLIGMEDGLFPSSRAEEQGDLEEERRLMYVAITRGRKTVHLSGSDRRMVQGDERDQVESRFVAEIPDEHLDRRAPRADAWHAWEPEFEDDYDDGEAAAGIRPEARVQHEQYGSGVVLRVNGRGMQARATVLFDDGAERQLLLEYAGLRVVSWEGDW